jgi:hypothetical protein
VALFSRILGWLGGQTDRPVVDPLPRRERRAAAKRRHQETGQPMWTKADRVHGGSGTRAVADVAPGTPGHAASTRSVADD